MEQIRHVRFDGYELRLFATNGRDWRGQTRLAYEFGKVGEPALFEGSDFCGSPMHADDSDETLRCLIGFLTCKPGDTDREYFDDYTPEQMAFAQSDAEALQEWGREPEPGDEYPLPQFENLDGWTNE